MKNAAALSRTPVTGPVAGGSRARRGVRPGERETAPADLSTRDRVTQLLLERGPTTAAQLGSALGLSPAAIRRHLDAMLADGLVAAFAAEQVSALEARCRSAMEDAGDAPLARAEALAGALTAEGYAANASTIASGGQLCQHHCPVAHVAAEFPQLCEAETEVISRLVGTHVQRLATIAHGDGVCTTHIPAQSGSTVTTVRTDR